MKCEKLKHSHIHNSKWTSINIDILQLVLDYCPNTLNTDVYQIWNAWLSPYRNFHVFLSIFLHHIIVHRCCHIIIGGVMVSVFTSSSVDHGFEHPAGQTKDYEIGICCFFDIHTVLMRKSKNWLARNQGNVYDWSDISTRGLLVEWASSTKSQLRVGHHHNYNYNYHRIIEM